MFTFVVCWLVASRWAATKASEHFGGGFLVVLKLFEVSYYALHGQANSPVFLFLPGRTPSRAPLSLSSEEYHKAIPTVTLI